MKFSIYYTGNTEDRLLDYTADECFFFMEPVCPFVDFDVYINKICLTVLKDNNINKIIEVFGFCPYENWQDTTVIVPHYKRGILRVLGELDEEEFGFSYGLNEEEWPEYVNLKTGWVCIGEPRKRDQAVEFIRNCVAVLEGDQLVALWLKPKSLPVKEIMEFRRSL